MSYDRCKHGYGTLPGQGSQCVYCPTAQRAAEAIHKSWQDDVPIVSGDLHADVGHHVVDLRGKLKKAAEKIGRLESASSQRERDLLDQIAQQDKTIRKKVEDLDRVTGAGGQRKTQYDTIGRLQTRNQHLEGENGRLRRKLTEWASKHESEKRERAAGHEWDMQRLKDQHERWARENAVENRYEGSLANMKKEHADDMAILKNRRLASSEGEINLGKRILVLRDRAKHAERGLLWSRLGCALGFVACLVAVALREGWL